MSLPLDLSSLTIGNAEHTFASSETTAAASAAAAAASSTDPQQTIYKGRIYSLGKSKQMIKTREMGLLIGNFRSLGYQYKDQHLEQVQVEFENKDQIPSKLRHADCFHMGFPEDYFKDKKLNDVVYLTIQGFSLELVISKKTRPDSPRPTDAIFRHPLSGDGESIALVLRASSESMLRRSAQTEVPRTRSFEGPTLQRLRSSAYQNDPLPVIEEVDGEEGYANAIHSDSQSSADAAGHVHPRSSRMRAYLASANTRSISRSRSASDIPDPSGASENI